MVMISDNYIVICKNKKECKGARECVHSKPHYHINCVDPKCYCDEKKTYCNAIDRKTICIPL